MRNLEILIRLTSSPSNCIEELFLFPLKESQQCVRRDKCLQKAASFASIGVKTQAACTTHLKCVTVRINATSNPLGLQHVPVGLMYDNCRRRRASCHKAPSEMKLEFKQFSCVSQSSDMVCQVSEWFV